ncbi:MAG: DUF4232 domain-containing protein [Actinomycetota bacterium]
MDDMEGRVRELLQRRADDVPRQPGMPPTLAGRAHRRFAVNAVGAAVVVVALAAGTFAALRPGDGAPVNTPGASVSSPAACSPMQLAATTSLQGAAGSRDGEIHVKNVSVETCTLEGSPTLELLDGSGAAIETGVTIDASPAGWVVNDSPEPAGWPVVTLAPGEHAAVRIGWSNWCGDPNVYWRLSLPTTGGLPEAYPGPEEVPPCNGPGQPSVIEVGPFEPSLGG